jgi:hypothetical protein
MIIHKRSVETFRDPVAGGVFTLTDLNNLYSAAVKAGAPYDTQVMHQCTNGGLLSLKATWNQDIATLHDGECCGGCATE